MIFQENRVDSKIVSEKISKVEVIIDILLVIDNYIDNLVFISVTVHINKDIKIIKLVVLIDYKEIRNHIIFILKTMNNLETVNEKIYFRNDVQKVLVFIDYPLIFINNSLILVNYYKDVID